jgi:modulator of FtsH protease HflC
MSAAPDSSPANAAPAAAPLEKSPSLLLRWTGFVVGALLVLTFAASFIVRENEKVAVLRFGRIAHVVEAAGWYPKLPWPVDRVVRLDARLQHGELRLSETITRDKRNVIVPLFFAWRIQNAERYLTRVGDAAGATEKLDAILTSARNAVLGQHPFEDLVAVREDRNSLAALESEIVRNARTDAAANLGLELVEVGILQINLPQANTESVFRRMRAERKREASQYRAEGRAQAETLRAETDKEAAILIADAKRYAEETRGKAEADAARIYAAAHGRDVEFYNFLRQLQSLRSVVDRNTTLILDTESAPFALLKHGPNAPATHVLPASGKPSLAVPSTPFATAPLLLDPVQKTP